MRTQHSILKKRSLATALTVMGCLLAATTAQAAYEYYKIDQTYTDTAFVDVAWHPSGDYALIAASNGLVLRVDAADWSLSQAANISRLQIWAIDFNPDGSEALIAGWYDFGSTEEGRLYRWDHQQGQVSVLSQCSKPGKELRAVDYNLDGSTAAVVAYSSNILSVYEYDIANQTLINGESANFYGPCDVAWKPGERTALITICQSSAKVAEFRPDAMSNRLRDTAYGTGVGSNAQAVDFHPTLGFAIVGDGSNNAIKWDGTWTPIDLPVGTAYNSKSVAFNSDGSRALITGRSMDSGSSTRGSVFEFTTDGNTFAAGNFSDVSLTGLQASPWFGDNNTYFHAVAFRPHHCEGLMVGDHGSGNTNDSPIARFVDFRGANCLPSPFDAGPPDQAAFNDSNINDATRPDKWDGDAATNVDTAFHDSWRSDSAGTDNAGTDGSGIGHDLLTNPDRSGGLETCFYDDDCAPLYYCRQYLCSQDCVDNSGCTPPLVCSERGQCQAPLPDAAMPDTDELDANTQQPDVHRDDLAGTDTCSGANCDLTVCASDTECSAGYYCNGYCVPVCYKDEDCPHDLVCGKWGRCTPPPEPTPPAEGCGCSLGHRGGWWAVTILCTLLWRRRRSGVEP